MNHWFFLVFVLFVAGIIVLAIVTWRANKKRREALRALAAARGWTYIERDKRDRPHRYLGFEPFGQGHSRYASNIMVGREENGSFEIFDYHYAVTRRSGKNTRTDHYHHKTVTVEMPIAAPGLLVRDEHLGHKIFDALGGEDIDFESHEFSKRFWVRCPDRRFAYDVVHPATMEFLLEVPGWTWQWRGGTLMMHRDGTLRPEEVDHMLGLALRFRRLVPRHLLAQAPT